MIPLIDVLEQNWTSPNLCQIHNQARFYQIMRMEGEEQLPEILFHALYQASTASQERGRCRP